MTALLLVAALTLWRSPFADGLRPPATFGASLEDLVRAWLPEAILIGTAATSFQRSAISREADRGIRPPAWRPLLSLLIWLAVWAFAYLIPGWLVMDPFAADIRPFVENFSLASIAWLVNGSAAMIIALLYAPLVLLASMIGAMLAAALLPAWRGLAGSTAYPASPTGFWPRFRRVLGTGALFWLWRGVAVMLIGNDGLRSGADAAVIALLLRRFVASRERPPSRTPD